MATIDDVARRAGVSTATVSAVINKSRYVSSELEAAVREAIVELNYTPNGVARSLAQQRTRTIGVIIPTLLNPIYPVIVEAIQKTFDKEGYTLVLASSEDSAGQERAASQMLQLRRVDGVIISPCTDRNLDVLNALHSQGIPIILLNRRLEVPEFDRVVADHASGTLEAVRHLVKLGRSRIALLALPGFGSEAGREREGRQVGYRQGLREHGLAFDPQLFKICGDGDGKVEIAAVKAVQELLALPQPPDAIIASSQNISLGALTALRAAGLNIPSDIALVGYDEFLWSSLIDPPLTVIAEPLEEFGKQAALLLLDRLAGKGPPTSTEIVLPTQLVIRASTSGSAGKDQRPEAAAKRSLQKIKTLPLEAQSPPTLVRRRASPRRSLKQPLKEE
jgi:DNA-binding LacI/PurR family transcriptional regulator